VIAVNTAPDGRAVAELVRDRDQGRDARLDMRMRVVDPRGGVRERRFTLQLLRGAANEDRGLIRFTQPADIKGTSLLVWKHAKTESERFLFLPALERVRRIAGGEAQESFVGSDFSYEDITGTDIDAYTYDVLDADATATDATGASYQCYKLQSKAREAGSPFPTTISFVDKASFIVRHFERLDRAGQRRKTYDAQKLAKVQGFWTVMSATMTTDRERTHTDLLVDTTQYNVGLTADDFSRRVLERRVP
jgi:hypothetical protein